MNQTSIVLLTGFGLFMNWLLIYFGWRPYRIDRVRSELFKLRNDLFIYAGEGRVSFNDPAYKMMRDRLNALIRYAHIISVSRSMIYWASDSLSSEENAKSRAYQEKFLHALHSSPAHDQLKEVNDKTSIILAKQVIFGCPPLLIIVVAIYIPLLLAIRHLRTDPTENTHLRVARELRVELIEEQAMFAQTQDRRIEEYELAHSC
jgi:hypothetical protein